MNPTLWRDVGRLVEAADFAGSVGLLEDLLAHHTRGLFQSLIGAEFSNPPSSVLRAINDFVGTSSEDFDVKAVYLEMNGFDINYDRWYFDFFAYSKLPVTRGMDWLCRWDSAEWPPFLLTGLEPVQEAFRRYDEGELWRDGRHTAEQEAAVLLVMVRFVSLVRSALATGPLVKQVPLLATAHDFDIFARFPA